MRKARLVTICLVIFLGNQYETSVLAQEQGKSICMRNSNKCKFSWECCSGCCNNGLCDIRRETCAQDKHPCVTQKCSEGSTCRLIQVNCFQAPCPPLPSCTPADPNPCQNFACNTGFHCELSKPPKNCANPSSCTQKPKCVRDSFCDKKTCPRGSTCVMIGKRPECFPSCDQIRCSPGLKCGLQLTNECSLAKCDLRPTCLPISN